MHADLAASRFATLGVSRHGRRVKLAIDSIWLTAFQAELQVSMANDISPNPCVAQNLDIVLDGIYKLYMSPLRAWV